MADVNANINVNIDASSALAQLRLLESQISNFNNNIARSNTAAAAVQKSMISSLQAQIEATGQFNTSIRTMEGNLASLSTAFDKGTLSSKQYFRYAASQMPGLVKAFRGLGAEQAQMADLAEERVKRLQTRYVSLGRDIHGMQKVMAIQPKTLAAGYATDIALAEQKQQLFNRALQLGTTGMVNWGKNTQWAGRQLMVGFTVPLTIAAGAAAKFFMDLDKSAVAFRRVYGEMGTSRQETERNLAAIQQLGQEYTKYGLAVNEVVDIGARAAAAGAQNEELLAATEQTLRLATLGQTDYQTALDATISLQTAFLLNSQELTTTIDFLNAVENQTVLTLEDMARAVPRVAPVIKGLGGDVQDLAVFMTALREGGVTAEQGANALKSGLASLINPTDRASETLKEMGINIKAIVDANRGDLMGTVKAFGEALNALSEFERQQALEAVFGKYQYARLGALFKNIARDGSQAARAMELAGMSMEDLASLSEKELSTVSESVTVKFLGAVERLKVAIAPIGEMFLKVMTPIIDVVANIANKFNELPDTVKTVIAGIVGAVGLIAPAVLMGIGLIANGIGNGLKFILALRGGIKGLIGVLTGSSQSFAYQAGAALDASAAMSALDGSAAGLTSSLLIQEGAVNSLAAAYGNMAGAARAAASSMPRAFPAPVMAGGRGAAPRRFARGGMVGGTGNQDTEPALLTPGEFVMNRQATERFGPILDAMNRGAIAGYAEGDRLSSVASHFAWAAPGKLSESLAGLIDIVGDLEVSLLDLTKVGEKEYEVKRDTVRLADLAGRDVDLMAGGKSFAGTTMMNESLRNSMFQAVKIAGEPFTIAELQEFAQIAEDARGTVKEKFIPEIDKLSDESAHWTRMLEESSDVAQTNIDFMREQTRSGLVLAKLQDGSAEGKLTAEQAEIEASRKLAKIDAELAELRASGIDETRLVQEAERRYKAALISESKEMAAGPVGTGGGILRDIATGRGVGTGQSQKRKVTLTRVGGTKLAYGGRSARDIVAAARLEAEQSVAKGAETASPSDATRQVGRDVGQGIVEGMNESTPAVKAAGENVGRAATGAVASGAKEGQLELFDEALNPNLDQDEQLALFNDNDLAAANKEAVDERKKNNFAIRQNTDATQKHTLQVKESTTADSLNEAATRKNTNLQVTKTQAGATMRPSIATTGAFIPAGTMIEDESASLSAALADQEIQTEGATKQTKGLKERISRLSGKAFGLSAAFTGMTIAGSFMGGQIGEVANSLMPVAFGMDAIAGLLPMMMNPVGLTIAAFAAVGGGLWFLNNQMNNVRAEAQNFADALTTSAAEVNKVASYFGNETLVQRQQAIDIAERSGVKAKDVAAGMEFIGSEVGQEMAKSFTVSLENMGGTQSVAAFANKLASMMMQGAIDFTQAKQIAAGLAQQMGQPEISAKIIGQLSRIVGPNGEDLERNPLKIAAEITANEQQIVNNLVTPATNAINQAMKMDGGEFALTALISPMAGLVTQLGLDIPYITDISKNLMSFINDDFEKATASVHAYGKAIGNSLRNAYDNLGASIVRNQEIIENAEKKDKPRLKEVALRDEAKQREQIAKMRADAEQQFAALVQQNAALSKEALDGMQVAIKEMYDDPTMQMFVDNLFSRTGGLNQEVRFDILMNLQTGQLNPMAANAMFDLIGNDEQAAAVLNIAVETQGLDKTNQFLIDNMQIEDAETRRRFVIEYTTEGDPKAAADALGFTDERRKELLDEAKSAESLVEQAWQAYETGTGDLADALRMAEAEGVSAEDWLQGYIDKANEATGALIDFDNERNRILSGPPKLQKGVTQEEFAMREIKGADTSDITKADVTTIQEYTLAMQDLAALDIKPKIDMSEISNQEELERVNAALSDFISLPEEVQKSINIDSLQATAAMADFDINWKKAGEREDIFKAIGVDTSQANSAMQAFGISWSQFAALPNISKLMVMTYLTRYVSVFERYNSLSQVPNAGRDPETNRALVQTGNELSQIENSVSDIPGVGNTAGGNNQTTPPPPGGNGGSGGSGGGESEKSGADLVKEMLDDLALQLKFLGDYKKKNGEVVSGFADALRRAGAPEQLIADIISKGKDGIKIAQKLLDDKAKELKKLTSKMLEVTRLTFVETQRAEAANLITQTRAQMALANSGISPEIIANLDPQQARAVSDAYSAYQAAQRRADAAKDKSIKKQRQANKDLQEAKKAWEQVTGAINENTTAQIKNLIAQARLERKTAENQIAASLTLAGQGFSGEKIAEIFEVAPEAANQIVAYTNKMRQLSDERERLKQKIENDTATKQEKRRYEALGKQLRKVRGDYNELIKTLQNLSKEQTRANVANTIVGMGARAVSARRQRTAQGLLMGQGLTFDQAESVAGDEDTAKAIVGANRQVDRSTRKLTAAEAARDKYLAEGGKRRGKEWERLTAAIRVARQELVAAKKDQDNLNASIMGMLTEESALEWESVQAGVTAEIAKQQNTQKFINLGIKDQLVLNRLNNLTLEQQNFFLSLSKEKQDAFLASLSQSITLAEKLANAFDRISADQQLQELLNEEATNKKIGNTLEGYDKILDSLQDQVRVQQDLLDIQQDKISVIEEENEDLNRGLELLSRQEEKINEAFDKRIEALDKVEQANARIAQQQQNQLNLSQALAEGDIYSATQAAQQIKQDNATAAIENTREALDAARQEQLKNLVVEVNGKLLTRDQIEKAIEGNNDRIYQIQENQIEPIEKVINSLNKQIDATNRLKESWQDYYKFLQDNAVDPITGLKYKDLNRLKEFYDAIFNAQEIKDAGLALQEAMSATGIKITPTQFYQAFGITNPTTPPTPTPTTTPTPTPTPTPAPVPTPTPNNGLPTVDSPYKVWRAFVASITGLTGSRLTEETRRFIQSARSATGKFAGGVIPGLAPRDSVPIMASPGEFVVRSSMVKKYGLPMFEKINQGAFEPSFNTPSSVTYNKINKPAQISNSPTMYNNNYSINVTAKTNANADEIASATVMKIRQMNSMQIRGARG